MKASELELWKKTFAINSQELPSNIGTVRDVSSFPAF